MIFIGLFIYSGIASRLWIICRLHAIVSAVRPSFYIRGKTVQLLVPTRRNKRPKRPSSKTKKKKHYAVIKTRQDQKLKKKHGLQQGQLEYNLSFLIVKKWKFNQLWFDRKFYNRKWYNNRKWHSINRTDCRECNHAHRLAITRIWLFESSVECGIFSNCYHGYRRKPDSPVDCSR